MGQEKQVKKTLTDVTKVVVEPFLIYIKSHCVCVCVCDVVCGVCVCGVCVRVCGVCVRVCGVCVCVCGVCVCGVCVCVWQGTIFASKVK